MKKQLIEEINNFRRLSGLLIKESGGEKALADVIISTIVKSGEKILPKEIGTFTTKAGTKAVLNVATYRSLLTKTTLSVEEKEILSTINKNIIREMGEDIFVNAIKEATKGLSRTETLAVEARLITNLFDDTTGASIKKSLDAGRVKPQPEPQPDPQPRVDDEGPVIRWEDDLVLDIPPIIDDILTIEQKNAVVREVEDVIRGQISMDELARINAAELQKISQLQKLRQNENGLELLKEKTRLQKDLLDAQRRNAELVTKEKELGIKEKEIEIAHKKNVNDKEVAAKDIQLKKERAELNLARVNIGKSILLTLGSLWVLWVGIYVYNYGWSGVVGILKKLLSWNGSSGEGGSSGGGGLGKDDY
jgi:hypothetical protein